MFTPDPWGNDSQFDDHIFQMGRFNHQLDNDDKLKKNGLKSKGGNWKIFCA